MPITKSKFTRETMQMILTNNTKTIGSVLVSLCLLLSCTIAAAQQSSEIDAVKAANQAFYSAFSARDVTAMQKVWSSECRHSKYRPDQQISDRWMG